MAELRSSSPDGRYNIRVYPWEARMSHWIETPELLDTLSGVVLIGFADSHWSLDSAQWQSTSVVQLSLRKYPGDHTPSSFEATVDCQHRTATIGDQTVELHGFETALEKLASG